MTKNTESLISACHELARVASCDDYSTLNAISDKLKSLQKESNDYKEMFIDSCKGLAAIARATGIKEENDSGSPGQVIDKINSMLNIDWNFTEHPDIKIGEGIKCWAYVERAIQKTEYVGLDEETGKACFNRTIIDHKRYVTTLTYQNKPSPTGENILSYYDDIPEWATQNDEYGWVHSVGWCLEYNHPDYTYYYEELDKNQKVLAWAELKYPLAPELDNE